MWALLLLLPHLLHTTYTTYMSTTTTYNHNHEPFQNLFWQFQLCLGPSTTYATYYFHVIPTCLLLPLVMMLMLLLLVDFPKPNVAVSALCVCGSYSSVAHSTTYHVYYILLLRPTTFTTYYDSHTFIVVCSNSTSNQ